MIEGFKIIEKMRLFEMSNFETKVSKQRLMLPLGNVSLAKVPTLPSTLKEWGHAWMPRKPLLFKRILYTVRT